MEITGDEAQTVEDVAATSVLQTERGVFQVTDGMEVVGADGGRVGRLGAVRPTEGDVLIHRPLLRRDVYAPFDAIKEVKGGALVLTMAAGEVDEMGWPHPPLLDLSAE